MPNNVILSKKELANYFADELNVDLSNIENVELSARLDENGIIFIEALIIVNPGFSRINVAVHPIG